MLFLRKYRTEIIAAFVFLIVLLIIANLFKFGNLTLKDFEQNKDAIEAIRSIITSILLILGAVLSYYRFFRGRTFSSQGSITLEVTMHDTDQDFILHAITLEFSNEGAYPIWEPTPSVEVYNHPIDETKKPGDVEWLQPMSSYDPAEQVVIVSPNESAQFYAFKRIPKTVWAVTYVGEVSAGGNTTWKKATTVSNITFDRKTTNSLTKP